MREKLNSNPLAQLAVVGVLLIGVAVFVMSSGGGSGEEEESATATTTATATTPDGGSISVTAEVEATAPGGSADALSSALPPAATATNTAPLPHPVLDAWKANKTLVLLFVRDGGIDDRLVKIATDGLSGFDAAAVFIVPAAKISRYAAIAEGVGVDRVPALVVVTPKHLKKTVPTASVSYGFRSSQSVTQAVIDAGYEGPTVDYHP